MAEVELWSLVLPGGKEEAIVPAADIRITNVSFGEELPDPNGRSVIKLTYRGIADHDSGSKDGDDNEVKADSPAITTVLSALTAGKIEQALLNVVLMEEKNYLLQNTGKNTVYLTGNYIDHRDEAPYSEEGYGSSDEEAYDLRDVSSDVEMNPNDLDGLEDIDSDASRFEEIDDQSSAKAAKRPHDSDGDDVAQDATDAKTDKKKNKKQKAESGKAVPTGADAVERESKEKGTKEKDKKEKSGDQEKSATFKELAGGLKVKESSAGAGPQAKKGNTVLMRYIGKLQNGTVFDKNTKGKPFSFKLGTNAVIKGWDEGILGMRAGGERILVIPPALAYGKKGQGPIPSNATLTFEVKLLEIK